jgi:hypothetical protein
MPRKSPEARGAALFRIAALPPEPPADLTPEGKSLWRETVRERPGDWFNPISTRLLHVLVQQLVVCGDLQRLYDMQDSYPAAGQVLKQLLAVSANCASIAARLRLTPQALIDRRSGQISEKGPGGKANDPLLGGNAVWGQAFAKKAEQSDSEPAVDHQSGRRHDDPSDSELLGGKARLDRAPAQKAD